jgi:hypothetical protein
MSNEFTELELACLELSEEYEEAGTRRRNLVMRERWSELQIDRAIVGLQSRGLIDRSKRLFLTNDGRDALTLWRARNT